VRIAGTWQLLDVTWGSGGTVRGTSTFHKQLDLRYLFSEPDFLLVTHFPKQPLWQLVANPIGLGTFQGILWNQKRESLYEQEKYRATTNQTAQIYKKNGYY
jgi:transglutaminase/protease-like cytokinesis protein 3